MYLFLILPLLFACENNISNSLIIKNEIIGKWSPTYLQSTKNTNGQWSNFERINTFVALPDLEFKSDGSFLSAGKPGAACCYAGNKYTIYNNNTLKFSEKASCQPNSTCQECPSWVLEFISTDSLIIEQCNLRSKFIKIK